MPTPSEHKIVQARILAYAQEIGWTFLPHEEAEQAATKATTLPHELIRKNTRSNYTAKSRR